MPTVPLFQVDAFADRPFAGNPAAVCPLDAPLSEALMQDIAAENNLSETAFFYRDGAGFNLRWFTPTVEVELCGHATLASAFVILTELEPTLAEVTFQTRSGPLKVSRREGDLFELDFPLYPPAPVEDGSARIAEIASALGDAPVELLAARSYLAVFANAGAIRRLTPDMVALARVGTGVCVTAPADGETPPGVDFVSRYFAPSHGIAEDPVTGSSFCTLAPYWSRRLGKDRLRARQVSRRGGEVLSRVAGQRVLIAGRAQLVLVGRLTY
jgi:PhzF family phenazine biosynthesis protein